MIPPEQRRPSSECVEEVLVDAVEHSGGLGLHADAAAGHKLGQPAPSIKTMRALTFSASRQAPPLNCCS